MIACLEVFQEVQANLLLLCVYASIKQAISSCSVSEEKSSCRVSEECQAVVSAKIRLVYQDKKKDCEWKNAECRASAFLSNACGNVMLNIIMSCFKYKFSPFPMWDWFYACIECCFVNVCCLTLHACRSPNVTLCFQ
jgi:hypothetical protein